MAHQQQHHSKRQHRSQARQLDIQTTTFHSKAHMLEDTFHEIQVPQLLALCGKAGSGKSTAAGILIEKWDYTLVKFAAPLKSMLAEFGLSQDEIEGSLKELPCALLNGHSPRHAMQTLGTEWGRNMIGENVWVTAWTARVHKMLMEGKRIVVDDCRFENELAAVKALGGKSVLINRPGLAPIGTHVSENGLTSVMDETVTNDGSPMLLVSRILGALA